MTVNPNLAQKLYINIAHILAYVGYFLFWVQHKFKYLLYGIWLT